MDTGQDSVQHLLSLNGPLFAIHERSEEGIPAVEFDGQTGKYVVLVFTSEESAKKYCWLRKPAMANWIFELPRRVNPTTREVQQVGLIRIARKCHLSHPEVSHVVFDHPGTQGPAHYATIDDLALLNRRVVPRELVRNSAQSLRDFIETDND